MDAMSAAKLPFNLKIIPITDDSFPIGVPFLAMFNPETLTIQEDVKYTANSQPGAEGSDLQFEKTKPRSFTIDFTLDGTGVNTNGVKIPVVAQVALFRAATTSINGLLHKPAFLIVQYGTFISTCALTKSIVTYTMFDFTGLAIRAKISASFTERTSGTLSSILNMLSSSDLTHKIVVRDWDILPLIVYKTYKDQNYYLQVAKSNKIKNFRKLKTGTELSLPPIGE